MCRVCRHGAIPRRLGHGGSSCPARATSPDPAPVSGVVGVPDYGCRSRRIGRDGDISDPAVRTDIIGDRPGHHVDGSYRHLGSAHGGRYEPPVIRRGIPQFLRRAHSRRIVPVGFLAKFRPCPQQLSGHVAGIGVRGAWPIRGRACGLVRPCDAPPDAVAGCGGTLVYSVPGLYGDHRIGWTCVPAAWDDYVGLNNLHFSRTHTTDDRRQRYRL